MKNAIFTVLLLMISNASYSEVNISISNKRTSLPGDCTYVVRNVSGAAYLCHLDPDLYTVTFRSPEKVVLGFNSITNKDEATPPEHLVKLVEYRDVSVKGERHLYYSAEMEDGVSHVYSLCFDRACITLLSNRFEVIERILKPLTVNYVRPSENL